MKDDLVGFPNTQLIEHLISKHERLVKRLIARRSGFQVLKRSTLEDLYQETVAGAIAGAETFVFHDDRSFMAWISTIARRVIARSVGDPRRAMRTTRIKGAESTGIGINESHLGCGGRTPMSSAASRERKAALREAIDRLPEDHRLVVTLYRLQERSLPEVAELMDRTKGATCRLLARAVTKLRKLMMDDGHVE